MVRRLRAAAKMIVPETATIARRATCTFCPVPPPVPVFGGAGVGRGSHCRLWPSWFRLLAPTCVRGLPYRTTRPFGETALALAFMALVDRVRRCP